VYVAKYSYVLLISFLPFPRLLKAKIFAAALLHRLERNAILTSRNVIRVQV
jgi:hypothetical protein